MYSSQQADAFTDLNMVYLDDMDKYKDWSLQVKTKLEREQLWDITEGTDEPPRDENDAAAYKAWSDKNFNAFKVIRSSCKDRFNFAIEEFSSAKIAWDILVAICSLPKSKLHRYLYISL